MISWLNIGNTNMVNARNTTLSSDYNDLTNKPTTTLMGTTQEPIKLWTLETGIYILNGYVQHSNELMSEAKSLFTTVTASLVNDNYVVSVYIPFWEGLYEYILPSLTSEVYTQHQVIDIISQYDVLTLDNEMEYTPTKDYHPSTKKYANDMLEILRNELSNIGVNKDNVEELRKANRRRDIIIQALLNQNSDKMVTIDEEVHDISLDLSIDNGIATINSLEGSTLVNVSKQKDEVPLANDLGVIENSNNVDLVNDTVIKPIIQGNTLVNNNAQWDDTVVIGEKIEEPLSGVEVDVENTYGEVDIACVGKTMVNLAKQTKSTVTCKTTGVGVAGTRVNLLREIPSETVITIIYDVIDYQTVNSNVMFGGFYSSDSSGCSGAAYNGKTYYITGAGKFIQVAHISPKYNATHFCIVCNGTNATEGDTCTIDNIMIFEGDLTQTPELIPTEYVEGLKSSFENENNQVEVQVRYCPIEFGKGGKIE